jgi:hypothetical protein
MYTQFIHITPWVYPIFSPSKDPNKERGEKYETELKHKINIKYQIETFRTYRTKLKPPNIKLSLDKINYLLLRLNLRLLKSVSVKIQSVKNKNKSTLVECRTMFMYFTLVFVAATMCFGCFAFVFYCFLFSLMYSFSGGLWHVLC